MISNTVDRVPNHTSPAVNERIRRDTERRVSQLNHAGPTAISRRLKALDAEWDIERLLEANAATATLIGLGLGRFVDRRFYALPAVIAGFLLQHAVQGWCPPLPVFRRLGFRTATEIDYERYALKAIRGDFEQIEPGDRNDQKAAKRAVTAAEA